MGRRSPAAVTRAVIAPALIALAVIAIAASTTLVAAAPAGADSAYRQRERIQYISRALDALGAIDRGALDALDTELYLGARRACRAGFGNPTVGCLIDLATKTCEGRSEPTRPRCLLIADLIVTNQLSQRELVDNKARIALLNKGDGFRAAMSAELRVHYAGLVTRLSMSPGFGTGAELPSAIDDFCVRHTRTRRLAWQRCVAAIVWYIGTADRAEPRR